VSVPPKLVEVLQTLKERGYLYELMVLFGLNQLLLVMIKIECL